MMSTSTTSNPTGLQVHRTTIALGVLVVIASVASHHPVEARQDPGDPADHATLHEAGSAAGYRVLATRRTSTMEKELNQAADEGFRLEAVMGGETAFGGREVVAVVAREHAGRYAYRLLATLKTSTMQDELQAAAAEGFHYRFQTVFETAFGGKEVVVILERDDLATDPPSEYLLLATTRTSTLEAELQAAAARGFELRGMTVAETAFGGTELVAITRRPIR